MLHCNDGDSEIVQEQREHNRYEIPLSPSVQEFVEVLHPLVAALKFKNTT